MAFEPLLDAPLTPSTHLFAASLELKTEKKSAHSDYIRSVAFNHDGTKIVSGSDDRTIKVWGALRAPNCQPNFPF